MSVISDPNDPDRAQRLSCWCGRSHSQAAHGAEAAVEASAAGAARELRERRARRMSNAQRAVSSRLA